MTDHLIILAGGASSRMKTSTANGLSGDALHQANTRSKALILINNRPMLDYVLYNARQAGIKKVYLVIGKDSRAFRTHYGHQDIDNPYHGLTISYAVQHIPEGREKPLGTADAVFQALTQYPHLQQLSFLVCNCDNLYSVAAFSSLRKNPTPNAFINYDRDALRYPDNRIARFALTKTNANNHLKGIVEKPEPSEMERYRDAEGKFRVSMNIFKFDGNLFYPYLKKCKLDPVRNEKELPTALVNMVADHPESTLAIPFAEHVPDLTSKEDISIMNDYLSNYFRTIDWD